jgi:hypothetical protein
MRSPNPNVTRTYLKLEFVWIRPENERESAGAYRNVINVVDDQMLIFDPQERNQGIKLSVSKAQRCGSMTFWWGSGSRSADLCLLPNNPDLNSDPVDPDSDPVDPDSDPEHCKPQMESCNWKVPSNRVTSSSCYNFVRVLRNFRTGLLPLFVKI